MTTTYTERSYYQSMADAGHNIVKVATADVLALYASIDELNATIANLNEGAKLLHSIATGGESKLLADWQIEAEALAAESRDYADQVSELRGG